MWDRFKLWLDDYLKHTDIVQLFQDIWPYLLAMIAVLIAFKYIRRHYRNRQP